MEFTGIGKENWASFAPIIFDSFTPDAKEVVRIGVVEDGQVAGEASFSFRISEQTAFLDSFYIMPQYRGRGFGKQLLAEVERLTATHADWIEGEFWSESDDTKKFFEKQMYACTSGYPLYELEIKELLNNPHFLSVAQKKITGVQPSTLRHLTDAQRNQVFEILQSHGERQGFRTTAGLSQDFSIVMYDPQDFHTPKAVLLSTVHERRVSVVQLFGSEVNDPKNSKFIIALMIAFAGAVKKAGGETKYDTLSMVAAHPGIKKSLLLLFGEDVALRESGLTHITKYLTTQSADEKTA